MNLTLRSAVILSFAAALSFSDARARDFPVGDGKITPALTTRLAAADPAGTLAVWVYFADKEGDPSAALREAESRLTPHARARRERNRAPGNLVDSYDIPVSRSRVSGVARHAVRVRHVSRWLNAVSVDIPPAALPHITAMPFVSRVDVVKSSRSPAPRPIEDPAPFAPPRERRTDALDYGASATQIQMMNVHTLHNQGLTGNGVWICMLDAGFNNLGHAVFQGLDVMITRDFVNGDSVVADQAGQMGSGNHGTMTLSVIGGFAPANLIGPAYGATYILAKTENTDWERHMEEDAWVAGAEWADSIGADIISSSLGYSTGFTNGEPDYAWSDLNGNTTIVTIGADIAASRGILVVNSAGNDGSVALPANTLVAPSDGDSVLCIGAVDAAGLKAGFSSVGPTADGRIKPDVMAMGQAVRVASPFDQTSYFGSSGTSFSCPLVAGVAALLLEARPGVSNQQIMDALRATASQASSPDRLMGWGIVNAESALALLPTDVGETPSVSSRLTLGARPNPFNPSTMIDYEIAAPARVTLAVYDAAGRLVDTIVDGAFHEAGRHAIRYQSVRASGVYFLRLSTGKDAVTRKIVLLK